MLLKTIASCRTTIKPDPQRTERLGGATFQSDAFFNLGEATPATLPCRKARGKIDARKTAHQRSGLAHGIQRSRASDFGRECSS